MRDPFETIGSRDLGTAIGGFDMSQARSAAGKGHSDAMLAAWNKGEAYASHVGVPFGVANGLYQYGRNVGQQLGLWQ